MKIGFYWINIPPFSQSDSIGYKEGMKGLRNAYTENLEVVLESVAELLENASGRILITADHEEYLGEYRRYSHGLVPRHPPYRRSPLVINRERKIKTERS